MDRSRALFVGKMAVKALKKHRVTAAPVDPFALAAAEGFLVQAIEGQPPGHCGWLEGMAIGYRREDARVRQRFTVAHELGHHFLAHKHDDAPIPTIDAPPSEFGELPPERSPLEVEANAFASALLMPFFLLQPALRELRSVERTASLFEVSREAMFIAIQKNSKLMRILC